jgi:hypothetical protein
MAIFYPFGKINAGVTYESKSVCELKEGQTCYDISGKDLRHCRLIDGQVVEDPVLKTKVEADDFLEARLREKNRNMQKGARIIALVSVMNEDAGFTGEQLVAFQSQFAQVQALLSAGSLGLAKGLIDLIVPDGVIITQSYKDKVLAELIKLISN